MSTGSTVHPSRRAIDGCWSLAALPHLPKAKYSSWGPNIQNHGVHYISPILSRDRNGEDKKERDKSEVIEEIFSEEIHQFRGETLKLIKMCSTFV